jgi:hypothetical protein
VEAIQKPVHRKRIEIARVGLFLFLEESRTQAHIHQRKWHQLVRSGFENLGRNTVKHSRPADDA